MTSLVVFLAGIAPLVLAWSYRPVDVRVTGLGSPPDDPGAGSSTEFGRRHVVRPVAGIGTAIASRVPALRPVPAGWLGGAAVVFAAIVVWSPVGSIVVAGIVATTGAIVGRRRARAERRREDDEMAALVGMLAVLVGAGATVRTALGALAGRFVGVVGAELDRAVHRMEHGAPAADAVERMGRALGPPNRQLLGRIMNAERSGAPLRPMLRAAVDGMSQRRRRDAEIRARRLPVLLLFPLVCCVLPAFVVLAIIPMVMSGSTSFFPL